VRSKNAFFLCTEDSVHVKEQHQIHMIHPLHLSGVFAALNRRQKEVLGTSKQTLEEHVNDYIENFCQKMCVFMKKSYLNGYLQTAQAEIGKFKLNDVY
jgi:hypothetical protein